VKQVSIASFEQLKLHWYPVPEGKTLHENSATQSTHNIGVQLRKYLSTSSTGQNPWISITIQHNTYDSSRKYYICVINSKTIDYNAQLEKKTQ